MIGAMEPTFLMDEEKAQSDMEGDGIRFGKEGERALKRRGG